MAHAVLVAGLGFGDEGKGSIVDFIVRKYNSDLVVRYNGGGQAGHNVVAPDDTHHTFSQFGSGTFVPGCRTHLSRFMLVNPVSLLAETVVLQEKGQRDVLNRLTVDAEALVTTPFHVSMNRIREHARDSGSGRHGSCGMGIGETMQDSLEHPELIVRVRDLTDLISLREKLKAILELKTQQLRDLAGSTDREGLLGEWLVDRSIEHFARFINHATVVDEDWLRRELNKDGIVVFEGAQGVLLDQDFGFQPHTTWTDTTFTNAQHLLEGTEAEAQITRLGVLRAFSTRHGAGPFVTESNAPATRLLAQADHNCFGPWQQEFRVGPLDLVATRYALNVIGGVDALALTNLDKLDLVWDQGKVTACTAYNFESEVDQELFTVENGQAVGIRARKPASIEHQVKLTRALFKARPSMQTNMWPFKNRVEDLLSVPIALTSWGQTAKDKRDESSLLTLPKNAEPR